MARRAYPAVDLILGKQRTTPLGRGVEARPSGPFRRVAEPSCGVIWPAAERFCIGKLRGGRPLGRRDPGGRGARSPGRCSASSPTGDIPGPRTGAGYDFGRVFSRGESRFNTEYRRDRYVVERADALARGCGAFAVMRYDDSGRTAAVACDAGGRTFVAGFPFESIPDGVQRDRLMRDVLRFFVFR